MDDEGVSMTLPEIRAAEAEPCCTCIRPKPDVVYYDKSGQGNHDLVCRNKKCGRSMPRPYLENFQRKNTMTETPDPLLLSAEDIDEAAPIRWEDNRAIMWPSGPPKLYQAQLDADKKHYEPE